MCLKGENISFGYKKNNLILNNVNISVDRGEVLGLIGDSGSGKSTLCKILAGYENDHKGNVSIDGKEIPSKGYNPVQLVFQHPEKAVNPKWKMKDILNEGHIVPQNILDSFGIKKSWLNRWPNELSGGELQRFALARALSPETKFLIADEITTMVDAITQAQIWSIVLDIVKELNIGVLVVSHEKKLIKRLCHDVVYLDDLNNA
ncbi:nickel ABC transporter ATP-binding protein [Methanosarcina sp. 2.H.T.1A.6]|uniref:ABC transporter ATP-binding protein n=1 Tax=unclassified Methanosarcina TaxID=2644672 RepID=UPI0006223F1E|nr:MULTISPECIES: ATP-binding cassette domain-containing protein [unclassified Methanosarcina]KKG12784.1 nickel ABC transporter ATP-binding protein [Methanosarcina sp. 2.H.T.1A.15]KKG18988.1 nickel ABC transporter ATP-binding protein [Methanosarcina sp. 2.H.T.1A.3]KKG21555.1 nickel ABC transporter ATP-binding protein [Methanosarcina sp. 2.H.T.1A.6]KKG21586.1 nickel ABC transporter ATP-binding protein [Methanosarcina sp. 2.H.T.1A.8]